MLVKLNRVYGNIKSISDLSMLQSKAAEHGLTAVGIMDTGKMFKLNGFSSQPVSNAEALALLNVNELELAEIIKYRGVYELADDFETTADDNDPIVEDKATNPIETPGIIQEQHDSVAHDNEVLSESEKPTDTVEITAEEYEHLKSRLIYLEVIEKYFNKDDVKALQSDLLEAQQKLENISVFIQGFIKK